MTDSSARDKVRSTSQADDHYAVLGVSSDADPLVISAAYKALIKKYHPDANGGRESLKAKRINEAFGVLGDDEARAQYDADRQAQAARHSTSDTDAGPNARRAAADNPRAGTYHMSWHWEHQPADRGIKIIGIVCALAAAGVLLGLLLPEADNDPLAEKSWTASSRAAPALDEKASVPAKEAASRASDGWIVGTWVREDTKCEPATTIVFRSDHSWSKVDASGAWKVEGDRLTLATTSASGATPPSPDTRIKTIVAIGPNEIKVADGPGKRPLAFDRCPSSQS